MILWTGWIKHSVSGNWRWGSEKAARGQGHAVTQKSASFGMADFAIVKYFGSNSTPVERDLLIPTGSFHF